MAQSPFYVYALKDPRTKPARPFYIGKGTGNRAWEHQAKVDDSEKGKVIEAIHAAGLNVLHTVISGGLTEEQALKIEAELISAFGIRSQGGLLTNRVRPNPENISRKVKLNIPDGCYEKAQMGLELLKAAVLELAKANPDGIKNSDAAKYLGLQSDYGGGSKDYLSYSLLGLLMKEGRIGRSELGKHVALVE
tara:strand:+ start:432 stop:1007 length:576 start_codon:yes stop_codon:yes gene_type:complete